MNNSLDFNKVVSSLVKQLNERRIYFYLRYPCDNAVMFYISPSQHYQALKIIETRLPLSSFNITYGIDSDFDYWINILKL